MASARWLPLIVDGGWNAELREAFDENSGAYAVREKSSGSVLYVGESHTGRGWKTLTRHFQDASGKFAKLREAFTHARPAELEAALWVTSKGPRTEENADEAARRKEASLIKSFRKQGHDLTNSTDKRAAVEALRTSGRDRRLGKPAAEAPDDFNFGANVKNPDDSSRLRSSRGKTKGQYVKECIHCKCPDGCACDEKGCACGSRKRCRKRGCYCAAWPKENPPPLGPNVVAERRAENRTPDLFTGRTKLEEGAKARKDWKGDAERLAAELAECRRGPPSTEKPEPDKPEKKSSPPQKKYSPKPEGFGEVDARGQAGMFRRNPSSLVTLGELVSLVYFKTDGGRRRVKHYSARHPPIVAYDPTKAKGALVIVFAPVVVGEGSARGSREYRRTHWGRGSRGELLEGDVLAGKAPRAGRVLEITYATRKGVDLKLVNYWHVFGDFGAGVALQPFIRPVLVAARVGGRELVRLDGGTYTVTAHGIVG